ncbi:hypothetical protein B0H10DRAFT_1943324 [Mycena sp. CBHHK59/15]|nr:hypothetical protein B0H10DRAFT_1943324 [Mycena sp. CBHHK59/15]
MGQGMCTIRQDRSAHTRQQMKHQSLPSARGSKPPEGMPSRDRGSKDRNITSKPRTGWTGPDLGRRVEGPAQRRNVGNHARMQADYHARMQAEYHARTQAEYRAHMWVLHPRRGAMETVGEISEEACTQRRTAPIPVSPENVLAPDVPRHGWIDELNYIGNYPQRIKADRAYRRWRRNRVDGIAHLELTK